MEQFHRYLLRQLPELGADELAEFTAAFTVRQVKKRQFIIQPGQVAAHLTYVVQGAFQAYVIDPAGVAHTIQFAIEDWWITDVNSYPTVAAAKAAYASPLYQEALQHRLRGAEYRVFIVAGIAH